MSLAIDFTLSDGVAVVTINRPERLNAMDAEHYSALSQAWTKVRDNPDIRVAVVTGAGEKSFTVGADLKSFLTAPPGLAEMWLTQRDQLLNRGLEVWKPVIAAINGFALGGGCETAMACTIRIAVEHAKFGQPEVKLGLLPGGGGTQRLPRLVGKGRALQLILSGEIISAQEAWRIGLVNEVVPASGLIARAEAILKTIASNAPIAVKLSLEAVNKGLDTSQSEGFALEASYFGLCAGTEDKKEGTSAFLEKRAPKFLGR